MFDPLRALPIIYIQHKDSRIFPTSLNANISCTFFNPKFAFVQGF